MIIPFHMTVLPGKVLIAYDEPEIVKGISHYLKNKGYFVTVAKEHTIAIDKARHFKPDLIVIDITMSDDSWAHDIEELSKTAIIFIIGNGQNIGGSDIPHIYAPNYISKPLKAENLIFKIETALGNTPKDEPTKETVVYGDFEINKSNHSVYYKGAKILLARKEFELLYLLASKPGRVFLRSEILQRVWGTDVLVSDRTIDVHIRKIRRKVGADLIKTVIRVGYKFQLS